MDDRIEHLTKETIFRSEKRIDILKKRTKRCVCRYCGGRLKLRRIIFSEFEDARIEIFCSQCDRIEFGVEKEIYISAKYFVNNSGFNCYPDLDDNEQTKKMTIAKVAQIMAWHDQNIGILGNEGFKIPLKINKDIIGDCITFTEQDLDDSEEIEEMWVE